MAHSPCDIVLMTPQCAFSGKLDIGDVRLSEFLNDHRQTVILLQDVAVSLMEKPSQVIARHSESAIPKSLASLLFEQQAKTLRPDRRFYSYVQKQEHPVYIVVDGIEIQGHVHTVAKLDLKRLLSVPEQQFLPVTETILSFRFAAHYVLKPNAVMVNVGHIQYVASQGKASSESKLHTSSDRQATRT